MYKIGIDVGGTNTDAVIINKKKQIVSKTKQLTTSDIVSGISHALDTVIKTTQIDVKQISHVMLGTTHCANALVERKGLNKIAHIRIGKPSAGAIAPLPDWPADLLSIIEKRTFQVHGGFEFDGRPIAPFDESQAISVLQSFKSQVSAVSVAGIFSKIDPSQEIKIAQLAQDILGDDTPVSMSYQIGGLGLLERENATAVNAALMNIASHMVDGLKKAVTERGIQAQLYISQNDGSLMSLEQARKFPVLTISSGPTNSLRGAGALSNLTDAIVIDVGGTTSDAGILKDGFPRESSTASDIGGIKTNFRMPDIVSVGIGGGTMVSYDENDIRIGPESVGYRLISESKCFGGSTLTLTDIALLRHAMEIPGASTEGLSDMGNVPEKVLNMVQERIEYVTDMLKTDAKDMPAILVGGGASILPGSLKGISSITQPKHGEVANAYGVAIASVSGEAELVVNLSVDDREKAIGKAKESAFQKAASAGANPNTVKAVSITDVPLAYLPNTIKIKVKSIGDLI